MMTCCRPMLKQHPLVIVGNTYLYAARRALRCDGGWGRPAGHDGDDRDDVPRFRDTGGRPDAIPQQPRFLCCNCEGSIFGAACEQSV